LQYLGSKSKPFSVHGVKPGKTRQIHKRAKKLLVLKTAIPATYKKHGKNIKKRLVNVNKGATFAPATATDVLRNTDRHEN